jgi:hypothetical protein
MNRIVGVLAVVLMALVAVASPSAAAPSFVDPEVGGVTVTVTFDDLTQTLVAGTIVEGTDNELPGLCTEGDIHGSCTPASDVAD